MHADDRTATLPAARAAAGDRPPRLARRPVDLGHYVACHFPLVDADDPANA